mmetsp:Transcript_72983/g.203782  ORF Transcript_72983/g.203782 Transcript_72983/m.203782 type:complete len:114 (+) Transcript_72983:177-518(+)
MAALRAEGTEWSDGAAQMLGKHSPTSVKLSLEAIRRHRSVTLGEAFQMEYRMSQWCMRPQPHSDFCEGIRAVLVDKDGQPKWAPATLEEVSAERVAEFFRPLPASHPRGELQV